MYVDQPDPSNQQDNGHRGLARSDASMSEVLAAAQAGQVQVDPAAGEAAIAALDRVKELVEEMQRKVHRLDVPMPLGGGYAEEISLFNQRLAVGGPNSAEEVITAHLQELEACKEVVRLSMAAYQEADTEAARLVEDAGADR